MPEIVAAVLRCEREEGTGIVVVDLMPATLEEKTSLPRAKSDAETTALSELCSSESPDDQPKRLYLHGLNQIQFDTLVAQTSSSSSRSKSGSEQLICWTYDEDTGVVETYVLVRDPATLSRSASGSPRSLPDAAEVIPRLSKKNKLRRFSQKKKASTPSPLHDPTTEPADDEDGRHACRMS